MRSSSEPLSTGREATARLGFALGARSGLAARVSSLGASSTGVSTVSVGGAGGGRGGGCARRAARAGAASGAWGGDSSGRLARQPTIAPAESSSAPPTSGSPQRLGGRVDATGGGVVWVLGACSGLGWVSSSGSPPGRREAAREGSVPGREGADGREGVDGWLGLLRTEPEWGVGVGHSVPESVWVMNWATYWVVTGRPTERMNSSRSAWKVAQSG